MRVFALIALGAGFIAFLAQPPKETGNGKIVDQYNEGAGHISASSYDAETVKVTRDNVTLWWRGYSLVGFKFGGGPQVMRDDMSVEQFNIYFREANKGL